MTNLQQIACSIDDKILKGPEVIFPPGEANIGRTLLDNLRKNRDFIGQINATTGDSLTYGKLLEDSCRCAIWFRKKQITTGDIVTIFSNNYLKSLPPFLSVWYVGAIVSPWNPDCSPDAMRYYCKLVKPKIIFVDEKEAEKVNNLFQEEKLDTKIIVLGHSQSFESFNDIVRDVLPEEIENFECSSVNPEDIAIFSLSSGSTGMRKCIKQTYEGQRYKNFSFQDQFYRNKTNMVIGFSSSLCSEYTIRFTNLCISTASLGIAIDKRTPDVVCTSVEKYKVQYIPFLASLFEKLVKHAELFNYDLSSLQHVMLAGSKMNPIILETAHRKIPNCVIFDLYGINDIGGITLTKYTSEKCKHFGIRYNVQVKFVDIDTKEILGPNKPGEMYVKIPYMMKGYYQNPKATEEAFDSEGWFRSGDFAYYDESGSIHFIDRLKAMIRYKNHLISSYEIQEVLCNHPEVIDAVVIGIPHKEDGECPTAFVIKAPDSKLLEKDLLELSAVLGENKRLSKVIFVKEIPYLISEKVDRLKLIELGKSYLMNTNK